MYFAILLSILAVSQSKMSSEGDSNSEVQVEGEGKGILNSKGEGTSINPFKYPNCDPQCLDKNGNAILDKTYQVKGNCWLTKQKCQANECLKKAYLKPMDSLERVPCPRNENGENGVSGTWPLQDRFLPQQWPQQYNEIESSSYYVEQYTFYLLIIVVVVVIALNSWCLCTRCACKKKKRVDHHYF